MIKKNRVKKTRAFVCTVIGVTAALTVFSVGPAQGAAGTKPVRAATKVDQSVTPAEQAAGARVVSSPAAAAALATIQTRIARYVATHNTGYTFGSYVDPTTGKIVLETDAPASVVSALTNLSGAPPAQRQAASQVQLHHATLTATGTEGVGRQDAEGVGRQDDIPPFYGGAAIRYGAFLSARRCSSGYAVRDSAGTRFMITAGHCYGTDTKVVTESGTWTYGIVSHRHLPTCFAPCIRDDKDMELIGEQEYEGVIYTGGVTSDTSIPVAGAGETVVGFNNYCHSGRATGEHCGHTVTSVTAQACTDTGCKEPVIAFTGGTLPQEGDSGSPFYTKTGCPDDPAEECAAVIKGHLIAVDDPTATGYVEPWTVVASTLGVSIVTP